MSGGGGALLTWGVDEVGVLCVGVEEGVAGRSVYQECRCHVCVCCVSGVVWGRIPMVDGRKGPVEGLNSV